MRMLKKLCAVVLALMLILSSMSGVFGVLVSAETETEAVTITESAREHLREQMRTIYTDAVAAATEAGTTVSRDSALNKIISITQSDPWHVYGTTAEANSWSDTKGYYRRYDSSSSLDLRYGHSDWSYTTASIRVSYKGGSASNGEALTALLRPDSSTTDSRKNAYIGLYYVAEVSGEYYISDNFGGFIVRSTAASGYNAYITIFANGEEIYKSIPLSRDNRIAKFDGATVNLQKGDKIEYRFTYEATADSFSGDIEFDFDPQISLLSQTEDVVLEGTGSVADMFFEDLNSKDPTKVTVTNEDGTTSTTNNYYVSNTQSGVWKAQTYKSGSWVDNPYYWNSDGNSNTHWMEWGYTNGSYSQAPMMAVRYYNNNVANYKVLLAKIPLNFTSTRAPVRIAYTAEYDGIYSLIDKTGQFYVYSGSTTVFGGKVHITVNGEKVWTSNTSFTTTGQSENFDGYSVTLKKGDILAIEFDYQLQDGQTDSSAKDSSSIQIRFAPELSYTPLVNDSVAYSALDAHDALFEDITFDEGVTQVSGTFTQPDFGWVFKYGMSADSLTKISKYLANDPTNDIWVSNYLLNPNGSTGNDPGIARGTGTSSNDYNKLGVHLRSRMENDGSGIRSGVYAYEYAYSFIAPYDGKYVLSQSDLTLTESSTIPGVVLKIYKGGNLLYSSDTVCNDNMTVTIPESTFVLSRGEELILFFERQDSAADCNFNNWMYLQYTPTITYYDMSAIVEEKEAYTPVKAERYYAENITAPVSISAFVKTNEILGGAIVSSDIFTLDIANHGYPRITFNDGSEIIFPVDVRSDSFNHIAVVYNSDAGEWYLYFNGVKASTAQGAGISDDSIAKLYVGASADKYNNSYFKGSIAELALFSTALTEAEITEILASGVTNAQNYWALSDAQSELSLEEISVPAYDRDDNGIAFTNHNQRLDLYEEFESPVNTFEAWVRLETAFVDNVDAGIITSSAQINSSTNYGSAPCVTLKIGANGKPTLVFVDESSTSIVFDTDIRSDNWVHLAITADYDTGYYYCYINGELVDKKATTGTEIPVTIRPYVVNGNYFNQSVPYYFQGDIAGISMFSDARTQSEILDDIYGVDIDDADLLGSWHIDDVLEDQPNRNGDGNDLHAFWATSADEVVDESFGNYSTFVFIPDTQNFTQSQGATGISAISNWILENKEAENIVGVMGLGDITNNNSTSQWTAAATGFESLKGQIPFVFISGNHDIEFNNPSADNPRDVTNFNTAFPYADWEPYMSGFYEEGKIDNMYYLLEDVNGVKYMMLGLEFQPRDAVLQWANDVVAAHPDYKVIVATHGYQNYSYTTKENDYISSDSYTDILGTDSNVGSDIWDKFASQHENIQAVFCGHVYHEDIHYTTNTGVNGNTVTEIIANAQTTDSLMRMSGTVLILRISEDGTKANINYYSPYHDHYLKDLNQFNIDWIAKEADAVAAIGNNSYATLEEAIESAVDGDTVTLLADVSIADTIAVSKNIIIDTATYSISCESGSALFKAADGMGMSIIDGVYTIADDDVIADIDASGKVDSPDLAYIRQVLLNKVNDGKVYDINGDNYIDIRDLVRIKKLSGTV